MERDVILVYARVRAFALAMPLLFLLPALPELVQHVVEFKLGMYASTAAFQASAASGARLGVGYLKVLALLLPGYWFVRYMAFGDARRAVRIEPRALAAWLVVFAVSGGLQALELFAPPFHQLVGIIGTEPTALIDGAAKLATTALGIYLTAWTIAAPLGNAAVTPFRSLALMAGSFWRTVGYMIAGFLPLMVLHYGLGIKAIGCPGWLVAVMLALDGLVVAGLAHAIAGATFVATRHALARKGVALVEADPTAATPAAAVRTA